MNQFICLDGKIRNAAEPVLMANNRGFRYGDALFETMRMVAGNIPLLSLHMERLFTSIRLFRYTIPKHFTPQLLLTYIETLCRKNWCEQAARIRLTVFRGHGGIFENIDAFNYLIECWPLNAAAQSFNENGLVTAVFPDAHKSCDLFSNSKTANYLPYVMAALYAKRHQLNECFILNEKGHIADGTISNLFFIHQNIIYTPALTEGCVAGVMRKFLINKLQQSGLVVKETAVKLQDLENADELFLTNAVAGIKWVKLCGNTVYRNEQTAAFYKKFIQPVFQ